MKSAFKSIFRKKEGRKSMEGADTPPSGGKAAAPAAASPAPTISAAPAPGRNSTSAPPRNSTASQPGRNSTSAPSRNSTSVAPRNSTSAAPRNSTSQQTRTSISSQPRTSMSAPGRNSTSAPPTNMASLSLHDASEPVSTFDRLNAKVIKSIAESLHPGFRREQLEGIHAGLTSARDMFAKNTDKRVKDAYRIGKLLGAGAFAKVFAGVHKITGETVAIKMINKNDPFDVKQRPDIIKEVAIMSMLKAHPHTTACYEAFEDDNYFILVLELCKGGELFDAIIKRHHLTEKEAAEIMKSIISVIRECHMRGIIHRDLKPENVLIKDDSSAKRVNVKIIDFGTSNFCTAGQELHQQFGTPYYVAPEVLQKRYNHQADVWSCGVIMYILLCGYPPFGGRSDDIILQKVVLGKYSFEGKEWGSVSSEAKDMIAQMLVMDTKRRATADALMSHPWFKIQEATTNSASNPMGNLMMQRLRQFGGMQRMKRLALTCLVRTLNNRDVKRLLELFEANDPQRTGKLDRDQFHSALERVGATIEFTELESLLELDPNVDHEGMIDYNDFVAAMLDTDRVAKKREAVRRSFEALDHDGDGMISAEDIVKASKGRFSVEIAREMVQETAGRECQQDEDMQIDYATFEKMMQA